MSYKRKRSFKQFNQFAVEKKHKNFLGAIFWGRRHQNNASHTISIYGNCMTSVFFQKTKIEKVKVFSRSSPKNA